MTASYNHFGMSDAFFHPLRAVGEAHVKKTSMILGVDPKVDYAFKYLFGREPNLPILVDVLESVLQRSSQGKKLELELLNPFNPKEALNDKLSILDIKARDSTGRHFIIEMQMVADPAYNKRIVYYATKLHQQQFHQGQEYAALRPTISISFLNHVLFPRVESHHLRFGLFEQNHGFVLNEDLEFHILELPKFTKSAEQLVGGLDTWLYFLQHAEKMDSKALPLNLEQPLVRRALEELKMLTQTDIERERYEARWKAQHDHISLMGAARREGRYDEKISQIHSYEQRLNRPATPKEQRLA
jgi:predicted transposase/invertase (TIGR01784 family)